MNRRSAAAMIALASLAVAGAAPALAGPAKAKSLKGTWSYTDTTPDATIDVAANVPGMRQGYCVGKLPAAPSDVNTHTLKVGGRGTLDVEGNTTGDWAMEVRTAKGVLLGGSDGSTPSAQEGAVVPITRAGTYKVIYCNITGAPTATASYTFKAR
jgi:hypothetical protein